MPAVKLEGFTTEKYEYATMLEMTNHIKAQGDLGWSIVSVNEVGLRAVFKKAV